jgi:hypothetical protein
VPEMITHEARVQALEAAPEDGWPDAPPTHKTRTRVYLTGDGGETWQLQLRRDVAANLRLGDPFVVTYEFGE